MRRKLGLSLLCVLLVSIASSSTASAWYWTDNPPGYSHSTDPVAYWDGICRNSVIDNWVLNISFCWINESQDPEDPVLIEKEPEDYCVWSIYYELQATLTNDPPEHVTGCMIQVHSYIYWWNSSASEYELKGNDWMFADEYQEGQTTTEKGCLHLYYNQHPTQVNEKYAIGMWWNAT